MRQHEYEDALISFRKVLELCGDDLHQKAMTAAEMGWAYIYLNDEDKAISYFAQSALADNESATREITALYHLSQLLVFRSQPGHFLSQRGQFFHLSLSIAGAGSVHALLYSTFFHKVGLKAL